MKDNNFKCIEWDCGNEFFIAEYTITDKGYRHKHKPDGMICCPRCGGKIQSIKKKGAYKVNFGKFSSMSMEDKKKVLKKRSKDHSKIHIPNHRDLK